MASTALNLEKVASSFLAAFKDPSEDKHTPLRATTCTHIVAPSSLHTAPKSNDEFSAHMRSFAPILSSFVFTAKEIHINEATRQITIWATGAPRFRQEVKDGELGEWEVRGEYIFILDINSEGKITRVLEFIDSKTAMDMRKLGMRARQNLGANGLKS